MKRLRGREGSARTIRARVLAIVLIPCASMLFLGVGTASYLLYQGARGEDWSESIQDAIEPGIQFISQVQEERRLSLLRLHGNQQESAALERQRNQVDMTLAGLGSLTSTLVETNPEAMRGAVEASNALFGQISEMREKIDARQVSAEAVYTYYNRLADVGGIGMQGLARTAPDADTAAEEAIAIDLLQVNETMARGNAFAAGLVSGGGMNFDQLRNYGSLVGAYHTQIEGLLPRLPDRGKEQYAALASSDAWKQVTTMETALLQRGVRPSAAPDTRPLPLSVADWQKAANQVSAGLLDMWRVHHQAAQEAAEYYGQRTFYRSLAGGLVVLVIALVAFLITIRMSRQLVRRLKLLRAETLELADTQLPRIVQRLRDGEEIDVGTAVPRLDHGRDEIGQVAEAFNLAQQTAVAAAAQEAKTRGGMKAVFLNIAHRAQVVVHRQLEVLDEAERKQEDPEHLELLFKLDHLATRARRNAENLVILGGGQPGRQWRNPVPLKEIVRSAVAETEDYARINTVRLPDLAMVGAVVADLVHLLAELVDNATSFSPPESRVSVRGNTVGKGIVIEVEDQGLGIDEEERERLNATLHEPPDFGVMTLSNESRLGLFVVAQLAARHGITVTLNESVYGGVQAIVLVPSSLIASVDSTGDRRRTSSGAHAVAAELPRPRRERVAAQTAEPVESTETASPGALGSTATLRVTAEQVFGEELASTSRPAERRPQPRRQPTREPSSAPAAEPRAADNPRTESPSAEVRWPAEETPSGGLPRWEAAENRSVPTGQPRHAEPTGDGRPPLPRRRRQTNLAPQLMSDTPPPMASKQEKAGRVPSPDQARDVMSAFQRGTRQGRQTPSQPEL